MKRIFDIKDMEILSCLRKDARQPLKKISKQIGLPISTIYDRIMRLEKNGLIESYTVMINYKKLQYPIKATIFLKATNGERQKLENVAFDSINTNKLVKLTGDEFNYLIEGVFSGMDALAAFVDKISANCNLEKHKVYYMIDEIKKEAFLQNQADVKQIASTSA